MGDSEKAGEARSRRGEERNGGRRRADALEVESRFARRPSRNPVVY